METLVRNKVSVSFFYGEIHKGGQLKEGTKIYVYCQVQKEKNTEPIQISKIAYISAYYINFSKEQENQNADSNRTRSLFPYPANHRIVLPHRIPELFPEHLRHDLQTSPSQIAVSSFSRQRRPNLNTLLRHFKWGVNEARIFPQHILLVHCFDETNFELVQLSSGEDGQWAEAGLQMLAGKYGFADGSAAENKNNKGNA